MLTSYKTKFNCKVNYTIVRGADSKLYYYNYMYVLIIIRKH